MKGKVFKKALVTLLSVVTMTVALPVCVMAAGNDQKTATAIKFDQKVSGSITSSNTADWYKVTLPNSGFVTVKAHAEMMYVQYYMSYEDNGELKNVINESHYWDSMSEASNTTMERYLNAGVYYFRVCQRVYDDSTGDYNFTISYTSSNESFIENGSGTNNKMKDASPIELGKTYTGFLAKNDEIDWYKFTLSHDMKIMISTPEGVGYFYLYNSDGKQLTRWYMLDWEKTDNVFTLERGTYYFVRDSDLGVYHFTISEFLTGWQSSGGKWYYYDKNGKMLTGWQEIDATWYYFDNKGVMQTGWQSLGGKWYYFNKSGAMQKGWQQISGKWYYFESATGEMVTGWKQIDKAWYYFESSGSMVKGWKQIGGVWYYFESSGAMAKGWKEIGKVWYYFNSDGSMAKSWKQIGGSWFYFESSGSMVTGWKKIGGKWYYFYNSGKMATNTTIDGYKIGKDGVMQ
ncbi:hypothetical protein [Butyrivibrio sp. AE2032]|uniref:hypothetical protein n=1 Tax=Butyrivibrio sp. AE2032 TaxID=1458463 RepID=UPI00068AB363|nr:hypothetical protein [Butyrivibrio sp. AE2032]